MNIDLKTTTVSLTTLASRRTYGVIGGDGDTKITLFVADTTGASSGIPLTDGRDQRRNTLVLYAGQQATFDDSSTFVGYALTGTAPTSCHSSRQRRQPASKAPR